ncbi:MAG: saccharopine dehydrogenase L-glutamate-forming [Nocardioidaceae bacterium]|jgi:saccharopine dehydrogenase (NAD+, L-glutamate forming)|nr:saccharopine dehydrogenase L-glutamate-forming [Nocardioidaceae bacterium]
MMSGMADRHTDFDVVLLGATGFTGGLAAEYLARHGPPGLRWALAGRDSARLDAVRERVSALGPAGDIVDTVVTDVTDGASLRSVTERTRVLATSAGPYARIGEPVVAACADTGTDYADLCGEREFVDLMWLHHHERALATGARIVHACGFDSVPHDLGALFTVQQLPAEVPVTIAGYVRAGGGISGGTYHSAVRSFSRVRTTAKVAERRRRSDARPRGRCVRALPDRLRRGPDGTGWAIPLPTIDGAVVRRSARALDRYGPDFAYGHFALMKGLPVAVGTVVALGAVVAVAQLPPGRDLLLRARPVGRGPSDEQRATSWFRIQFVGEAGGRRVVTEVRGGDPGYDGAALMLGESALCLALDDLPGTAGQVTTAQSMGDTLRERIQAAGIGFRVVSST